MRTRLSSGFVRAEQCSHSVLASRTEAEGNILTAHGGLAGNNGPAGQGLGVRDSPPSCLFLWLPAACLRTSPPLRHPLPLGFISLALLLPARGAPPGWSHSSGGFLGDPGATRPFQKKELLLKKQHRWPREKPSDTETTLRPRATGQQTRLLNKAKWKSQTLNSWHNAGRLTLSRTPSVVSVMSW